jgi:hypothetical protein
LLIKEFKAFFSEWIDFKYEIFWAAYFYKDDFACDLDLDLDFNFDLLPIFFTSPFLSLGLDWADKAEIVFKVDFLF